VSSIVIAILLLSELSLYMGVSTKTELVVDVTRDQKMRINFNLTFPRVSCHGAAPRRRAGHGELAGRKLTRRGRRHGPQSHTTGAVLSVDVMDVAGEHQSDIAQDIYKVPLDEQGTPLAIVKSMLRRVKACRRLRRTHALVAQHARGSAGAAATTQATVATANSDPLPPNYCGSCYGAEVSPDDCCNTCNDVRRAHPPCQWAR